MSVAAEETVSHIDATGARPVIAGTDIKVSQIASEYEHLGMSPDEIAEAHTHLGLSEVHAALAYYYDHRDVIHRDWADADTLIAKLQEKYLSRLGARARRAR